MTTTNSIDTIEMIRNLIEAAPSDPVRAILKSTVEQLMSAEASAMCGAGYRERSGTRSNVRNGYRERQWDTRVGSIDLAIPKLREGSYFPEWLLEPRRRAEQALWTVVATAYLEGVSTRNVDKLCKSLGVNSLSRSQVSRMASTLDAQVAAFRERRLSGSYRYLWVDALAMRVREAGEVVNAAVQIAVGVNDHGQREVLGVEVSTSESTASWTLFLRSLVERGLAGCQLVISDAHAGLREAIETTLPGVCWQRCRTHAMRNLLTKTPKRMQQWVATAVRTIFAQPEPEGVVTQFAAVVEHLRGPLPEVADKLATMREDLLAFRHFPVEHWKKIWSNNPQERLNKEIRRRTDVVGIFPDRHAIIRLVGALLAEQTDEWAVCRRYMTFPADASIELIDSDTGSLTAALPPPPASRKRAA
jgi:transposase-like protein